MELHRRHGEQVSKGVPSVAMGRMESLRDLGQAPPPPGCPSRSVLAFGDRHGPEAGAGAWSQVWAPWRGPGAGQAAKGLLKSLDLA